MKVAVAVVLIFLAGCLVGYAAGRHAGTDTYVPGPGPVLDAEVPIGSNRCLAVLDRFFRTGAVSRTR